MNKPGKALNETAARGKDLPLVCLKSTLFMLGSCGLLCLPVAAQNGYWNYNGSGTWSESDTEDWLGGVVPDAQNAVANFPGNVISASATITLNSTVVVGGINFYSTNSGTNVWTIAAAANDDTLVLSTSTGTPVINVPFSEPVRGLAESDTISATINGDQGFTLTGGGNLVLAGANFFTGTITLTGTLRANTVESANGINPFNNQQIVETGSANGDSIYFNVPGPFSGPCSITNYGPPENDPDLSHLGAIRFATSGTSLTGIITLLGPAGITARGASSGSTISGQITDNGRGYTIRFGRTSTSSSAGSGILILSCTTNNWTGNTTNTDGTLRMGAAGVIPNGPGFGDVIMTTPGVVYQPAIADTVLDLNGYDQTINGLSSDPNVTSQADLALLVVENSSSTPATLTVGNGGSNGVYAGLIRGAELGLGKIGSGTQTLNGGNSYTGATTISAGTLALASAGSIGNSSLISIAAGGTFDVSALPSPYNLSFSNSLSASGAGTTTGSSAATINGPSGGIVSLGSQGVALTLTPVAFNGDTAHPALFISQGALTLSGNTIAVVNAAATPLRAGTYTLIQVAGGAINGAPNAAVTVTGAGLAAGATASNSVSGGNVNLVVVVPASKLQVLLPGETAAPDTATGKTGTPTPQIVGAPFSVTVNAVDANFNVVSTATPTVAITSSDGGAVLPGNAALVKGTGTFMVALYTPPAQTVTATDKANQLTAGLSASVSVLPATFTLSTNSVSVGSGANNGDVVLTVNSSGAPWTATANDPWLHVTPNGTGSATVDFTNAANPGATRSGTITIAGQTFTVTQAGSQPTTIDSVKRYAWGANIGWIDWNEGYNGALVGQNYCSGFIYGANVGWINLGGGPTNGMTYENLGNDIGVNLDSSGNLTGYAWGASIGWINFGMNYPAPANTANVLPAVNLITGQFSGYAWSASCGWINLSTGYGVATDAIYPSSTLPASMLQVLLPGETAMADTATGKTGTPTPQIVDAPFSVTVNAVDVNFNVVSTATPTVEISSRDSAAVLPANAALVNGTGTFMVTLNTPPAQTVTATDTATSNPLTADTSTSVSVLPPTFTLGTKSDSVGSAAGQGSVILTVNSSGAPWTATANDPWLHVTPNGTGSATVGFTNAANPGATRLGTITIAGQTFTVTQAGSQPTTIDSVKRYAWGANIGWIDWNEGYNGALVGQNYCSGFIYGANVGWINLGGGPTNGMTYENLGNDFGVNLDSTGNLTGYAWGASIGWINFGMNYPAPANTVNVLPAVNLYTGQFGGYAWGASIGWVNLNSGYGVLTAAILPDTATQLQILLPGETAAPGTSTGKTGMPYPQVAGTPFQVIVNAVDVYFNPISSKTPTVAISSSDLNASLPGPQKLVGGSGVFLVTLNTSGFQTVTASDTGVGGSSLGSAISADLAVNAANSPTYNSLAISATSTTITVAFTGIPGATYVIQSAPGITGPWSNLTGNLAASSTGELQAIETISASSASLFFRAKYISGP